MEKCASITLTLFSLALLLLPDGLAQARISSSLDPHQDERLSDLPPGAPEELTRARRSSENNLHTSNNSVFPGHISASVGVLGVTLLLVLPITITGLLCCKRMGAGNGKRSKRSPTLLDETSPFDCTTNPMNATADYTIVTSKEFELDRSDSCVKNDSLYRSDSFHPLGSPTFSTFSIFDSKPEKEVRTKTKKSKLTARSSSEPNLLDDSSSSFLPLTFTKTEPSHVSRLLRESTPHTALTGSTVSLVPAPSLTHSTPSQSSLLTHPHTETLKPVYIIPPEVERVEVVRTNRSPQIPRKQPPPPTAQRLNSATSVSSLGSACSGQRHLSDSCEQALTMDTDQPSPVFRTVARVKESNPLRAGVSSRDSVTSNTGSIISYVLTRDPRPLSGGEARPPPSLRKVPSPLHVRADVARTAASSDSVTDIKQRALPPTPHQTHTSTHHTPLTRTSATLKTYRSPLLSKDESSLDSHGSRQTMKREPETVASWTLPTKKQGGKLILKSIKKTEVQPLYHTLETSSSSADVTMPTKPPPRPPRKLIDPTRQVDFSHLLTGLSSGAGDPVRGEACVNSDGDSTEPDPSVCIHCGRPIGGDPFYICVTDSDDGSTSAADTASSTTGPDAASLRDEDNSEEIVSQEETTSGEGELSDHEVRPKPSRRVPTGTGGDLSFEEELQPGSKICLDCVKKEGPIYHELEPADIEAILSARNSSAPPIPPRDRPAKSPVYERIASVKRKLTLKLSTGSRVVTRVSVDGAYIIEASRPRRPKYSTTPSTDYEQVSTDLDTPPSPHYHRASEVHRFGESALSAKIDPAKHVNCLPHPPPLSAFKRGESSSHDYESLPGSFETHRVNLRHGLANRRGSHDYAFIGPAPSIESLNERSPSPPWVPPGAQRATLMRIDSQGYASVIIPDRTDEMDCLVSGQRSCPFHASLDSIDMLLPQPNDYEVPAVRTSQTEEPRASVGRASVGRLARQKAVSESESTQEEVSSFSITIGATSPGLATLQSSDGDRRSTDKGSIESVQDSELTNEEVFDSGFENSNEGLELGSPQIKGATVSLPPVPPRPPRPSSLFESERDKMVADTHTRPRSRTFNVTELSPQETTDKKIHIFLNEQSSVLI